MSIVKTDVLICGSGSAGLCSALWLAHMGIDFRIIEKRDGPLQVGQADGVSCRTVEIFESFGLDQELTKDAYWVNEVVFWTAADNGMLQRTRRTADVLPGMSWKHHVIMNQAHLNALLLNDIVRLSGKDVDYNARIKEVQIDRSSVNDLGAYPVTAISENPDTGEEITWQSKYLIGSDGAHSAVRTSLGYQMIGDTTDSVWGVMDIYPLTNFPDIRKKSTIRSIAGNLIIIPREGGSKVRFYIQLPAGTSPKSVKLEDLHAAAKKIFSQYDMGFAETSWWSAYSIGQRLVECFSKDNRIFLAGDASHTHSPKAGQGMNLSLADGYNLGWKLGTVIKGHSSPELLKTYDLERGPIAAELIDFDRDITSMLKSDSAEGNSAAMETYSDYFIKSANYAAGVSTRYSDSMLINSKGSTQSLAWGATIGMRFPSRQAVRLSDARAIQLSKVLTSDGRWRIMVFAGDVTHSELARSKLEIIGQLLLSSNFPIISFTLPKSDADILIEAILIIPGNRIEFEDSKIPIPDVFTPITGKWRMKDINKVFVDDESYNYGHGHVYRNLGIDVRRGAVLIIRPDQYVSMVTSLEDFHGIESFFTGIFNKPAATASN